MNEKIKGMFGNPERAEEVKEWLKSQGAKELDHHNCHNYECVYFVKADGSVSYMHKTYAELFDIVELPKPTHEFKPFDRVLVRDSETGVWIPSLYCLHRENKQYPHLVMGSNTWKYCIPYEGNKHLVGTTKNPEEE